MSFDPWISEWGNPPLIPRKFELHESAAQVSRNVQEVSTPEYIGCKKRTQGTETSKYLQERTSTETPQVVASERGPGQWSIGLKQNGLERPALRVTAPYA